MAGGGLFFLLVHLLADAVAALRALRLAFAGLARGLQVRLRFLGASLAGLRVLRLRAHFVSHAVAVRRALLALAGLGRLFVRGAHLGAALLARLRILRLRAVEALLAGRFRGVPRGGLGEGEGRSGEQAG